jgi:hypothetical protein
MCPPNFALSKTDPLKNSGLHYELHLKPNMLIKLCAGKYYTNDGLVNGAKGFLKITIE